MANRPTYVARLRCPNAGLALLEAVGMHVDRCTALPASLYSTPGLG